jgi:biopolymer transport protein ExbD
MSSAHESDRLGHDSEVIAGFLPLVDVLLAVLCVALVAAGGRDSMEVPVTLPQGHARANSPTTQSVLLTVDRQGDVSIDGASIPTQLLPTRLAGLPSETTLLLAGDAAVPYECVARLLHALQEHGSTDVRLLLQQEPQAQ